MHKYDDHPENKVSVCARKVAEFISDNEHKGTQIVFSDIGTPKPDAFNIYDALKEKLPRDFNILRMRSLLYMTGQINKSRNYSAK